MKRRIDLILKQNKNNLLQYNNILKYINYNYSSHINTFLNILEQNDKQFISGYPYFKELKQQIYEGRVGKRKRGKKSGNNRQRGNGRKKQRGQGSHGKGIMNKKLCDILPKQCNYNNWTPFQLQRLQEILRKCREVDKISTTEISQEQLNKIFINRLSKLPITQLESLQQFQQENKDCKITIEETIRMIKYLHNKNKAEEKVQYLMKFLESEQQISALQSIKALLVDIEKDQIEQIWGQMMETKRVSSIKMAMQLFSHSPNQQGLQRIFNFLQQDKLNKDIHININLALLKILCTKHSLNDFSQLWSILQQSVNHDFLYIDLFSFDPQNFKNDFESKQKYQKILVQCLEQLLKVDSQEKEIKIQVWRSLHKWYDGIEEMIFDLLHIYLTSIKEQQLIPSQILVLVSIRYDLIFTNEQLKDKYQELVIQCLNSKNYYVRQSIWQNIIKYLNGQELYIYELAIKKLFQYDFNENIYLRIIYKMCQKQIYFDQLFQSALQRIYSHNQNDKIIFKKSLRCIVDLFEMFNEKDQIYIDNRDSIFKIVYKLDSYFHSFVINKIIYRVDWKKHSEFQKYLKMIAQIINSDGNLLIFTQIQFFCLSKYYLQKQQNIEILDYLIEFMYQSQDDQIIDDIYLKIKQMICLNVIQNNIRIADDSLKIQTLLQDFINSKDIHIRQTGLQLLNENFNQTDQIKQAPNDQEYFDSRRR